MTKDKYNKTEKNAPFEYVNKRDIMEKIEPVIDNTLMRYGFIPVEVELVKENHRWFLRIFMFSTEKEVGIDDCEKVSRSLSDFLEELIPFKYYLEVSSPGMERKLKSAKEYLLFILYLLHSKIFLLIDKTSAKFKFPSINIILSSGKLLKYSVHLILFDSIFK